jgi:hypothetical protein
VYAFWHGAKTERKRLKKYLAGSKVKIMKHTIRWILVLVVACAICSLVTNRITNRIAYHSGQVSMIRIHSMATSSITLASLQKLRAGDIPGVIRLIEPFCFGSAENFFNTQPPPNDSGTEMLAQELLQYRATYRTNSADWDVFERKLEVELASEKQTHSAGWDVVWSGTNGMWSGTSK